jgi:anti-sigma regulatory factor (Ser/Thr protein kinase)
MPPSRTPVRDSRSKSFATPQLAAHLAILISHVVVRDAQGLRPGGFGLLMARKLVDDLIYSEKGNEVLLVKYLPPAASQVV